MNPTEKEVVIEQAKNLALTISLLNGRYDKLLGEFNSRLSEVYMQLKDDVTKSKDTLDFIAQNVAYQSNLDETKFKLNSFVKNINDNLENYSILHEHPYSLDSHLHEQYSNLEHIHDYVSPDLHNQAVGDLKSKLDTQHSLSNYSISILSNLVLNNYNTLLNSLEKTSTDLKDITKLFTKGIDNLEYKLDTFKSNTKKDINDLTAIIDSTKTEVLKQLSNLEEEFIDELENQVSKLNDKIDLVNDSTKAVQSNLKDSNKDLKSQIVTSNKAIADVSEQLEKFNTEVDDEFDLVDKSINKVLTSIDEIQDKHETLEDSIDDAIALIKTRPEYSEILLKEDLDKLKKDIIDAVPVPKDGKNASEWQFKPHPSRKGVLIFKKDTDRNWNYIDLNHIVPKVEEYEQNQSFSYIGGGGGGSSGYPILWNNVLVSSNSSINFIGSAITSVTNSNDIVTIRIDSNGVAPSQTTGTSLSVIGKYTKQLSGYSVSIPLSEYKINEVTAYYVADVSGKVIEVSDSIINGTITIESNIELTNYILYISGFNVIKKYIKALSGTSISVTQSEHGIIDVISYEVRDINGNQASISNSLNTTNNTITIQSNVDLTNYTLTIRGI